MNSAKPSRPSTPVVESSDSPLAARLRRPDVQVNVRDQPPAPKPSTLVHWVFLGMSIVVMVASLVLTVRDQVQVIVPLIDKPLPGTCTFRRLTGLDCPGCGLTRSFISLAHGQWRAAWGYNPAGVFFFAIVVFQIPYRVTQIVRIRRGIAEHRWASVDNWILIGLAALLLVQWIIGLLTHVSGMME